jgi:23S rRNA (adenine2503-C2)-methyltransferase
MNTRSIHNPAALEAARTRAGIEPEALRRWHHAFFVKQLDFATSLGVLPPESRKPFAEALRPHSLDVVEKHPSNHDHAVKLVLRTEDGQFVESVLMQADSGRVSLCVSSQVGCACGCSFCATGAMHFTRNLSADEILDQVVQARAHASEPIRNVVFMGMGEPLLNLHAVSQAVASLISPTGFGLAERRVMVSTCGMPRPLVELAQAFPGIGFAISLHAARQSVRERLMPIASRHPIPDLRAALAAMGNTVKRDIMLEILLLDGVNDTPADAEALVDFARGLPVYINLLSYNPIPSAPDLRPASEASFHVFQERLEAAGHKVTRRYSHGGDIAAACGQLATQAHASAPSPHD